MYGFTLIFVLTVIGGVIAYIGDKIGMKVGRKRLTLFGLRPKYTGIIITIITGIFISLASIVVLTIASDDVRTALFEMKEIQATLASNQEQLKQVVLERDAAAADLAAAQAQLAAVQEQYSELEQKRNLLEDEVDRLNNDYQALLYESLLLYEEYLGLYNVTKEISTGDMIFSAGQIIYAAVVESSPDISQIYAQLESIWQKADQKAYAEGARADSEKQSGILTNQEQTDIAARMIHQAEGLFVVRIWSGNNAVVGQPVVGNIQIIQNGIVFQAEEVLSEITVDLNSAGEVDRQILNLMAQAKAVAVDRGMITSEDDEAVEITAIEIASTVSQVRELAGAENRPERIKIQAKAMEDTWAVAGPVKIRLEIVRE